MVHIVNNGNKALKAGIWYTFANYVTRGAIFLVTPIFTRIMTKEQIGDYSNVASWVALLSVFCTCEFSSSLIIARFDYKEEFNNYISSSLIYGSVVTLLFYSMVLLNINWFEAFFQMPRYAIHFVFIYILFYPALQMFQYICRFNYNYKGVIYSSLLPLLLSTLVALFLTWLCQDRLYGRIVGYYSSYIFICIIYYMYFLLREKRISFKFLKYAFAVSFPMVWHALAGQVLSIGDRIIITKYADSESTAMYSIAYTCAMIVNVLWSSMNSAWAPWATEQMNQQNYEKIKRASLPYVVAFVIIAYYVLLFGPELLLLFGGNSYLNAISILPPIIIGFVFQFIYSLYVNAEFFLKKQARIATGTIIAAILNLILNIIYVPKFGYIAAAYTTLVGFVILAAFHFVSVKTLKVDNWFNNKFFIMVCLISLSTLPLFDFIYCYFCLRIIIIVIYTLFFMHMVIKEKSNIFRLIKLFK